MSSIFKSSCGSIVSSIAKQTSLLSLSALLCLVFGAVSAHGTAIPSPTYVVTTTSDTSAGNASNCQSGSGTPCSLRDAIAAVNADSNTNDIIGFSGAGMLGTITLVQGGLSINPSTAKPLNN